MDFSPKPITLDLNKLKYKLIQSLAQIFVREGCIIFGGWARDQMIHDFAAGEFYRKGIDQCKYDDSSVDASSINRLLIANDIDVFVRGDESAVDKLLEFFTNQGLLVRNIAGTSYFKDLEVKHRKYKISTPHSDFVPVPMIKVKVDIIFTSESGIEPPFNRCDLECNAFLFDKNGFRLSRYTGSSLDYLKGVHYKLAESRIINDVLKIKTDVFKFVAEEGKEMSKKNIYRRKHLFSRIFSMQRRGWIVSNIQSYTVHICNPEYRGKCDICTAPLGNKIVTPLGNKIVTLQCCGQGRKIHLGCFSENVNEQYSTKLNPSCTHCETEWSII